MILTSNMLKDDEDVFLDDVTLDEVSNKLNTKIVVNSSGGKGIIKAILGTNDKSEK